MALLPTLKLAMSGEDVGTKNVNGLAMLVSTHEKSRAHAYISHAGGQAVLVWAAGLLLCSCYAAQNEHVDAFLAELTAHIAAAGPATRWAAMGDYFLEL